MTVIGAITPAWSLMETNLLPPVFTFVTGNCKKADFFLFGALFFFNYVSISQQKVCLPEKSLRIINVVSPLFKEAESHFNDYYIHKLYSCILAHRIYYTFLLMDARILSI